VLLENQVLLRSTKKGGKICSFTYCSSFKKQTYFSMQLFFASIFLLVF